MPNDCLSKKQRHSPGFPFFRYHIMTRFRCFASSTARLYRMIGKGLFPLRITLGRVKQLFILKLSLIGIRFLSTMLSRNLPEANVPISGSSAATITMRGSTARKILSVDWFVFSRRQKESASFQRVDGNRNEPLSIVPGMEKNRV